MPKLLPIRALRFDCDHGDITTRIAPPYDVLDEGPKQELLACDPHNIVAIDLPVTPPKTVGPDSAYQQAGQTMAQWVEQGILKRDDTPAVYAYEQAYTTAGVAHRRRGLFASLGVEEFNRHGGGIWRHEKTIKSGTDDRLKLMEATGAQLSPIFGVFHDPEQTVAGLIDDVFDRKPDMFGTTANDQVEHRVWRIDDAATLDQLQRFFEPTDVFIADGHHRYTTALNYHKAHPDKAGAAGCLFVLVAVEDPGMIVLPTHRIICDLQNFTMDQLHASIAGRDDITLTPTDHGFGSLADLEADLPTAPHHAMGVLDPASGRTWLMTFSADPLAAELPNMPDTWRQLDVAVLSELFIDRILRPTFGGDTIIYKYTANLDEMKSIAAQVPASRLAIIMQATPLESVTAVARVDQVMPPKSTYFFPKLATGLVINPLD
jgi:uncharacterized protein (DUF1015 family)